MISIERRIPASTTPSVASSALLGDQKLTTNKAIQFNDALPRFLRENISINGASNEYIEKRLKETVKSRSLLQDALALAENADPSAANSQLAGVLKAVLNPTKISEGRAIVRPSHGVSPEWSKVTYSVQPLGLEIGFNLETHNGKILPGASLIECSNPYRDISLIESELKKLFPFIVDALELHTLEREAFSRGYPWLSHRAHRKDLETSAAKERLTLQELRIAIGDDLSRVFQPTPRGERNLSKRTLDFIELSQKLEHEKVYSGRISSMHHGYHTFAVAKCRAARSVLRTGEEFCFVLIVDAKLVEDQALAEKLHRFFEDRVKRT